ncbi:hypothetical protein ACFQ1L_35020 [Phytohabitans flavus]|uniref:WXG100-like domain-containing protein n=1 Tax=Phytohabitans flavus TaxID=1076124 RepID=UPI00362DADE2
MGIEVSDELANLLLVLTGEEFPRSDESQLWALAGVYADAAAGIDDAVPLLVAGIGAVRSESEGPAADAFVSSMEAYMLGEDGYLPFASRYVRLLGDNHEDLGLEVFHAKMMTLATLIQLLAQLLLAFALAWANPAGPFMAMLMASALLRFLLSSVLFNLLLKLLVSVMAGVALQVLLEVLVQRYEIDQGKRAAFNPESLKAAAGVGALGGVIGLGPDLLGDWLAKALKKKGWLGPPSPTGKPSTVLPPPSKPPASGPDVPNPKPDPKPDPGPNPVPDPKTGPDGVPGSRDAASPRGLDVRPDGTVRLPGGTVLPAPGSQPNWRQTWFDYLSQAGSEALTEFLTEGSWHAIQGEGFKANGAAAASGLASATADHIGKNAGRHANHKLPPPWNSNNPPTHSDNPTPKSTNTNTNQDSIHEPTPLNSHDSHGSDNDVDSYDSPGYDRYGSDSDSYGSDWNTDTVVGAGGPDTSGAGSPQTAVPPTGWRADPPTTAWPQAGPVNSPPASTGPAGYTPTSAAAPPQTGAGVPPSPASASPSPSTTPNTDPSQPPASNMDTGPVTKPDSQPGTNPSTGSILDTAPAPGPTIGDPAVDGLASPPAATSAAGSGPVGGAGTNNTSGPAPTSGPNTTPGPQTGSPPGRNPSPVSPPGSTPMAGSGSTQAPAGVPDSSSPPRGRVQDRAAGPGSWATVPDRDGVLPERSSTEGPSPADTDGGNNPPPARTKPEPRNETAQQPLPARPAPPPADRPGPAPGPPASDRLTLGKTSWLVDGAPLIVRRAAHRGGRSALFIGRPIGYGSRWVLPARKATSVIVKVAGDFAEVSVIRHGRVEKVRLTAAQLGRIVWTELDNNPRRNDRVQRVQLVPTGRGRPSPKFLADFAHASKLAVEPPGIADLARAKAAAIGRLAVTYADRLSAATRSVRHRSAAGRASATRRPRNVMAWVRVVAKPKPRLTDLPPGAVPVSVAQKSKAPDRRWPLKKLVNRRGHPRRDVLPVGAGSVPGRMRGWLGRRRRGGPVRIEATVQTSGVSDDAGLREWVKAAFETGTSSGSGTGSPGAGLMELLGSHEARAVRDLVPPLADEPSADQVAVWVREAQDAYRLKYEKERGTDAPWRPELLESAQARSAVAEAVERRRLAARIDGGDQDVVAAVVEFFEAQQMHSSRDVALVVLDAMRGRGQPNLATAKPTSRPRPLAGPTRPTATPINPATPWEAVTAADSATPWETSVDDGAAGRQAKQQDLDHRRAQELFLALEGGRRTGWERLGVLAPHEQDPGQPPWFQQQLRPQESDDRPAAAHPHQPQATPNPRPVRTTLPANTEPHPDPSRGARLLGRRHRRRRCRVQ